MVNDTSALSEQTALVAHSSGDSTWLDRLLDDDPLPRLGDAFQLNAMTSPTAMRYTRLVHPEARRQTGQYLRDTLVVPGEQSLRRSPLDSDPVPLDAAGLSAGLGIDASGLPQAYAGWRLAIELYILLGRDIYLFLDDVAMPYRRLGDSDLGRALTQRLLPFAEPLATDAMLFLVGVPNRLSALGGLRGHRTCYLEAGLAQAHLSALTVSGVTWSWHTEFFDDACCQVLGVDGVERAPLLVGRREDSDFEGDDECLG